MEVEVTPKAAELIAIIALLSEEADALRERIGQCEIRFNKRVFTGDQLARGAALCAQAKASGRGSVEIRIES